MKDFSKTTHFDLVRYAALAFASLVLFEVSSSSLRSEPDNEPSISKKSIPSWRQPPAWEKGLVIYEVATKAFTSPNGPQSGTFDSLKAKLPYLQELGITGIWLSGHSLSDSRHFYNIWTQYAVIEPERIDPSLGTEEQFRELIGEAHRRGIRIFLDVVDHGVMATSSLVKSHPDWFLGGSWGMVDYDYMGGHTDLDDWWVKIWTDAIVNWGADGFRLDTNTPRPDLWARIRQNAFAAGHPIIIFEEFNRTIPGVTDFSQHDTFIGNQFTGTPAPALVDNIPYYYAVRFGHGGTYKVRIQYADGSSSSGSSNCQGPLRVGFLGRTEDKASYVRNPGFGTPPDGIPDVQLSVANVEDKPIQNVVVTVDMVSNYRQGQWALVQDNVSATEFAAPLAMEGRAPVVQLYLPTTSYGASIMLSCHDNGWTADLGSGFGAFPLGKNPYTAQGSRSLFGYSFLFTPMVPIFMAGEEFDAVFHSLPTLSTELFGGKNPGKGRWLYGSMLNWSESSKPGHREMLDDVKRMLVIRRQEADVLAPQIRGDIEPQLAAVPYTANVTVPAPYMRWNGNTAIVVLGNRNTDEDASIKLKIPVEVLGPTLNASYKITDLWNGGEAKLLSAAQMANYGQTVKRDKTERGGVGVLKIERVE